MPNKRWIDGGFHVVRELASGAEQLELARLGAEIIATAPLLVPKMPDGTPFRCMVTGAGEGMFFSDERRGYHYTKRHPATGAHLPPIPGLVLDLGIRALERAGLQGCRFDSMLLNHYDAHTGGRLGLHVDAQEVDVTKPLVSISLGADCEFAIGGLERAFKADKVLVTSGDAVVMSGRSRMWFHGVERTWHTLVTPLPPGIRWAFLLRAAFA
jgi:DNA oxidative demethylase